MFVEPDPSNPQAASVLGSQVLGRGFVNLLWRGAKGLAGDAWDLVSTPGQILEGSKTPYPGYDNSIDPAGYAARLAGYGMGVGSALVPETSAGIFGGSLAKTARLFPEDLNTPISGSKTLADAMTMQMGGAGRDEIFDNTGWFQGADGGWRFTISDEGAKLKLGNMDIMPSSGDNSKDWYGPKRLGWNNPPQTVGDMIDHPELFKAYPDLADIRVRPQYFNEIGNQNGSYDLIKNELSLAKRTPEQLKSTLLHELQHAVQARENFARGGNPDEFLSPTYHTELKDIYEMEDDLRNTIKVMGSEPYHVQQVHGFGYYDKPNTFGMTPEHLEAVNNLPPELINDYKDTLELKGIYEKEGRDAYEHYLKLAGEAEARIVQAQNAAGIWNERPWMIPDFRDYGFDDKANWGPNIPFEMQTVWPQDRPIKPGGGLVP